MSETARLRGAAALVRDGFEYGTMRALGFNLGEEAVVASGNMDVTGTLAIQDGRYVLLGHDGSVVLQMGSPQTRQFARAWEPN